MWTEQLFVSVEEACDPRENGEVVSGADEGPFGGAFSMLGSGNCLNRRALIASPTSPTKWASSRRLQRSGADIVMSQVSQRLLRIGIIPGPSKGGASAHIPGDRCFGARVSGAFDSLFLRRR